jgi:MATE family, multidrug efflux pump
MSGLAYRALRRSPYDRQILRLALPALGALAAEPLYILVDTAIVGHLGRPQLAALGIAGAILTGLYGLFNFLAYATTAHVARYDGAGQRRLADVVAAQSLWLSLGIGLALLGLVVALAEPAVTAMGAEGRAADYAVSYLRIAAIGLPSAIVALAGQGYLRGISDLRTPLVIVVIGNVVNVVLEVLFVYGFDWGIRGSAWGTAIAQTGMGVAFVLELLRPAAGEWHLDWARLRGLVRIGRHIFVRTSALIVSFVIAGAVITRFGDASIGAHQVAFQLWVFLALVLDAIAIAGQVMVGRALGAGDDAGAFDAASRMIVLSVIVGAAMTVLLFAAEPLLPLVFTSDEAVLERVHAIWPLFALMQPLNGAVFALDGILIGAGDSRFLMWAMLGAGAVFCGLALIVLALDWGAVGVWCALFVLIVVRLAALGVRFMRRRWAVTGWA